MKDAIRITVELKASEVAAMITFFGDAERTVRDLNDGELAEQYGALTEDEARDFARGLERIYNAMHEALDTLPPVVLTRHWTEYLKPV